MDDDNSTAGIETKQQEEEGKAYDGDKRQESQPHQQRRHSSSPASSSSSFAYDLGIGKNPPVTKALANDQSSSSSSSSSTKSNNNKKDKNQSAASTTSDASRKNYMTTTTTSRNQKFHESASINWVVPDPVRKPSSYKPPTRSDSRQSKQTSASQQQRQQQTTGSRWSNSTPKTTRRMVARDQESQRLRHALWDEMHYSQVGEKQQNQQQHKQQQHAQQQSASSLPVHPQQPLPETPPQQPPLAEKSSSYIQKPKQSSISSSMSTTSMTTSLSSDSSFVKRPTAFYPDIDLSIPDSVYSNDGSTDLVWDLIRWEALQEAQREPLLVSFLHSTILNHASLESSLAFLLANRLQSPAMMISTQLQSLILEALQDNAVFRKSLRADMMAVRDRDPACNCLPDVFLYFKGFHALQAYRVAHVLWRRGKHVLAQYMQSQVSQVFQIDIHPNATLGSGIMLDHGTGIVIGETARVGHNCSILHHVTLGGSGKKGVDRHPAVGNGVLLGAGATLLGPVQVGDGSQVGAGTLVISNLPAHCVAVGVPARVIGSFIDVTEQPSIEMNQMIVDAGGDQHSLGVQATFETEGI